MSVGHTETSLTALQNCACGDRHEPIVGHVQQGAAQAESSAIALQLEGLAQRIRDQRPSISDNAFPSTPHEAIAMHLYQARRAQVDVFGDRDIAFGPCWDMLLDLFIQQSQQRRVSISDSTIAAECPPTTALRWIKVLEARGLVVRRGDEEDLRRTFLELTAFGTERVTQAIATYRNVTGVASKR